jgi:hypothetical protein
MAVVAIDTPRLEGAVHEAVLTRTADVIHDLVVAVLPNRLAHTRSDISQRFVPADPLPLTAASLANSAHRVQNPLGVIDLIDRCWPLRAVASSRAWVRRVAFKFEDLAGVLVDVRQQSARRLAVEARRRNEPEPVLDLLRPRLGVVLLPVIPPIRWRKIREVGALSDPWKFVVYRHINLMSTARSGLPVRMHHREAIPRPSPKGRRGHRWERGPRR